MIKILRALPKKEAKSLGVKGKQIFLASLGKLLLYIVDKEVKYLKHPQREEAIPVLWNEEVKHLPKLTVDLGAVKFIASGADVLRPGVVEWESFKEGDAVVVVDEKHKVPIAVGIALVNSEALENMEKGKVVKNLHHIGDALWKEERS